MNIGERIRQCRERAGLTQDELARLLGYISRSSVNKVVKSRELSNKKVRDYANALDVTPAYLMGWEEQEPDNAELMADISMNQKFVDCVNKMMSLPPEDQQMVFGYVEALYSKSKTGD